MMTSTVVESFANGEKFNIAYTEIAEVSKSFDKESYEPKTVGKHTIISWGADNKLPYTISEVVSNDEVLSENKLFNIQCLYGLGLEYVNRETGEMTDDEEISDFCLRNAFSQMFLEMATDMKYYYMSAMVVTLSKDRSKIAAVHPLEVCNLRFGKADASGRIKQVFYADWKNGKEDEVIVYPLLDMRDPLTDLMVRTGRETEFNSYRKDAATQYVIVTKFPTPGFSYYPAPYYLSVFKSGWFEIKQLAALYKKTKLKNFASIKYLVTIDKSYWDGIFQERGCIEDMEKQIKVRKEVFDKVKTFVTGIENTNKLWVTGSYTGPDGKQIQQITITKIDTDKEGGDYSEENQEACNMLCYADGVHPNLVGAVPGKAQSNNSGSDKRELFTLKQTLETPFRQIMLVPHKVIIRFNGWSDKVKPIVPMALLTTLDQHKDTVTAQNE